MSDASFGVRFDLNILNSFCNRSRMPIPLDMRGVYLTEWPSLLAGQQRLGTLEVGPY